MLLVHQRPVIQFTSKFGLNLLSIWNLYITVNKSPEKMGALDMIEFSCRIDLKLPQIKNVETILMFYFKRWAWPSMLNISKNMIHHIYLITPLQSCGLLYQIDVIYRSWTQRINLIFFYFFFFCIVENHLYVHLKVFICLSVTNAKNLIYDLATD